MTGRPKAARVAALAVAIALAALFSPLARPGAVLATRDMAEFNLPLRASWALAARGGGTLFPQWDPFAHGGQPLLSNPNYGAFYPPSWLTLLLPLPAAVAALVLLQAIVAAIGAWRLARGLGARGSGAALAALVYAGGATYLALLHSLSPALGMSWLPWLLDAGLRAIEGAEPRGGGPTAGTATRSRAFLAVAASFALLLLSGSEPTIVLIALVALGWRVVLSPARLAALASIVPSLATGAALGAAQLLPALARGASSVRAGGLPHEAATTWSLPPARVVELVFPWFFGDAARPYRGHTFGRGVHDLDFPYLLLLHVTLPLAVLGLVALARLRVPARGYWAALAGTAIFLALGRRNPLYEPLREHLPGLATLRYPEKFALLALVALLVAGAVQWSRLLDERDRGERRGFELPLALAVAAATAAVALAAAARAAPAVLQRLLQAHSPWPLDAADLARAVERVQTASSVSVFVATATVAILAFARFGGTSRRALAGAMFGLVAVELWTTARPLLAVEPAPELLRAPAAWPALHASTAAPGADGAARAVADRAARRIFSTEAFQEERNRIVSASGDVALHWARAPIERLGARVGNLFDLSYALDKDFDLSLTEPAHRALALYGRLRARPEFAHRLLGAWSVDRIVIQRAPVSLARELAASAEKVAPVVVAPNAYAVPSCRLVASWDTFADVARAEGALIAAGLPLDSHEFLVGAVPPGAVASHTAPEAESPGLVVADDDRGDRRTIEVAASRPALLVVATTYDRGWRATLAARDAPAGKATPLALYETAAGYLAAPVPAGEHRVALRYRDPWVARGAALSAVAAVFLLAVGARARRISRHRRIASASP